MEDAILKEAKTHLVYAMILDTTHKQGWGCSDLTKKFLKHLQGKISTSFSSTPGMQMLSSWNPSKAKMTTKCWVYGHMSEKLDKVGIKPKINIMDNKASMQVCHFITNMLNASYQKVVPHCHQANAAEKPYKPANTILLLAFIHWLAFPQSPMGWPSSTSRIHAEYVPTKKD